MIQGLHSNPLEFNNSVLVDVDLNNSYRTPSKKDKKKNKKDKKKHKKEQKSRLNIGKHIKENESINLNRNVRGMIDTIFMMHI